MMSRRKLCSVLLVLAISLGGFTMATGLAFTLSGCQTPPAVEGDKAKTEGEAATEGATAEAADASAEEGDTATEEEGATDTTKAEAGPVDPMATFPYRELTFTASDDVKLVGRLYDPTLKPVDPNAEEADPEAETADTEGEDGAPVKPPPPLPPTQQYPLVLLLHQLGGSHRDWGDLPIQLVKKGYAVLALDARGHGKSTVRGKRGMVSWRNFGPTDWQWLPKDISRVLTLIETDNASPSYLPLYRHLNTHQVAILGASIGANTAIFAGSALPDRIRAIGLLSPGIDYKGLVVSIPIVKYRNPIFIAASESDSYSNESSDTIYHWGLGEKSIRIYKNIGHGTDMLANQPDLDDALITWLGTCFLGGLGGGQKALTEKPTANDKPLTPKQTPHPKH
jgi:pimeloyl-ACP methyl ester carboxylesterase